MNFNTILASVLSSNTAFANVKGIRDIQRAAKNVDFARDRLNSALRDMTEHTARMMRNASSMEFYDRGSILSVATQVTVTEAAMREELARFYALLDAPDGLYIAFEEARLKLVVEAAAA